VAELDDRAKPVGRPGGAGDAGGGSRHVRSCSLARCSRPGGPLSSGAAAAAQRVGHGFSAKTMAVVRRERRGDGSFTPIIPSLGSRAAPIATLLQKQFDTENPATYISATDGGGAVAASAASGLRDDLEKRSSLLGSGGRAVSVVSTGGLAAEFGFTQRFARSVWLQRQRRRSKGGSERFSRRYLTITSEGRETWAAGSLRGFIVWAGLARAGLARMMGSEETTDGHVSKFIALSAIAGLNVARRTELWFAEGGCVWNSSRIQRFPVRGLLK
jgi:hypothetical protein